MARRRKETLDQLLADIIAAGELTAFCKSAGLSPYTVLRLRRGIGKRNTRGVTLALAAELDVPEDRVRRAIEASRG